jgi:hypothetical protein
MPNTDPVGPNTYGSGFTFIIPAGDEQSGEDLRTPGDLQREGPPAVNR